MKTPKNKLLKKRIWYAKNKEEINRKEREKYDPKKRAKWYQNNIEHNRVSAKLRHNKARKNIKSTLIEENGGKCSICGYNKCKRGLHFHHKDPDTKIMGIASCTTIEIAREEVKKCILVCANCHSEIHDGIKFMNKENNKGIIPDPKPGISMSDKSIKAVVIGYTELLMQLEKQSKKLKQYIRNNKICLD